MEFVLKLTGSELKEWAQTAWMEPRLMASVLKEWMLTAW
jgi:hypothetical protein